MPETASSLSRFQTNFAVALVASEPCADPALARALSIHRNTAAVALRDALAANYPVVRALFGKDAFATCAAGYVTLAPPREPRLNAYGAGFADYLRAYAPAMETPYMGDVAVLERLCTEAIFAADAKSLDGAQLTAGLDPAMRLRLHPATRFAAFASPAAATWLAHRDGDDDALGALLWEPQVALVTRPFHEVLVMPLDVGSLAFLRACEAGEPLIEAARAAASAGADLQTMFQTLISTGAFADADAGEDP